MFYSDVLINCSQNLLCFNYGKKVIRPPVSIKKYGSGGIRTHAPEETGALNQRLRPLGHATLMHFS